MKALRISVVVGSWIILILPGVTGIARAILHLLPATTGGGGAVILVTLVAVVASGLCLFSRHAWKVILGGVLFILGMMPLIGVITEHQAIY